MFGVHHNAQDLFCIFIGDLDDAIWIQLLVVVDYPHNKENNRIWIKLDSDIIDRYP